MKKNTVIRNIGLGVGLLSIGLLFNVVRKYHGLIDKTVRREEPEKSEDGIFYKTNVSNND